MENHLEERNTDFGESLLADCLGEVLRRPLLSCDFCASATPSERTHTKLFKYVEVGVTLWTFAWKKLRAP
eukprot:5284505-Amphidinium_carterae.2